MRSHHTPAHWATTIVLALVGLLVWIGATMLLGDWLGIGYVIPGLGLLAAFGLWYDRRYLHRK